MTKILAIDPSSVEMGYAVLDDEALITYGIVTTAKSAYEKRFTILIEALNKVQEQHKCDSAACELAMRFRGKRVPALETSVECIKNWAKRIKLPISLYNVSTWKASVIGNGHAGKDEVARMVKYHYQLELAGAEGWPDPSHIMDAVAIGLHHRAMMRIKELGEE